MSYTGSFKTTKFQIVDKIDHPPKIIMKSAHANKIDRKHMYLQCKKLEVWDKSTSSPVLEI